MTFKEEVEATAELQNAWRPGLQALKRVDKARVTSASRSLSGSVDLHGALSSSRPNDPAWDYGVGVRRRTDEVVWLGVHPARPAEIRRVEAKLTWLKRWLRDSGSPLRELPRTFIWVASGKASFQKNDPLLRQLANEGLTFAGGHLRLS